MRGRWFAGWIIVGALGALTVLGALSIGIFVLPVFGLAFAFVARQTRYPLDVLGGLAGIARSRRSSISSSTRSPHRRQVTVCYLAEEEAALRQVAVRSE